VEFNFQFKTQTIQKTRGNEIGNYEGFVEAESSSTVPLGVAQVREHGEALLIASRLQVWLPYQFPLVFVVA